MSTFDAYIGTKASHKKWPRHHILVLTPLFPYSFCVQMGKKKARKKLQGKQLNLTQSTVWAQGPDYIQLFIKEYPRDQMFSTNSFKRNFYLCLNKDYFSPKCKTN